jgi:periplasmic divalent cation tolerance protein
MPVPTRPQRVVLVTCPDRDSAEAVAGHLVAEGLAACVNIVPGISSVYQWQGKIEQDDELLLIIKTHVQRLAALTKAVQAVHPYELPEVVAVPITEGLDGYLNWIDESVDINENN